MNTHFRVATPGLPRLSPVSPCTLCLLHPRLPSTAANAQGKPCFCPGTGREVCSRGREAGSRPQQTLKLWGGTQGGGAGS